MKKYCFIVTAVLMQACAYQAEDTTVYVPSNDNKIMAAAIQAADEWNVCNKYTITITNKPTIGSITLGVTKDPLYDSDGRLSGGLTVFSASGNPTSIIINDYPEQNQVRVVIAHEFGHLLIGEKHLNSGLMSRGHSYPSTTKVTQFECNHIED
jgi:Zn-dependent peptidase ImmA (M78 family)